MRKKSNRLGTVMGIDGGIKVKWDDGQTSYYRHGEAANVQLPGLVRSDRPRA